jgi:hypothetical protein
MMKMHEFQIPLHLGPASSLGFAFGEAYITFLFLSHVPVGFSHLPEVREEPLPIEQKTNHSLLRALPSKKCVASSDLLMRGS